ncbi:MAG: Chemotaxis protein methyltransferase [Chlamydiae bacterium]|nr:Chemotaxis protein methyltransferase [Chlamydiota bacterium]
MRKQEIEKIEVDILLDAICRRYGYDFQNYAKASLKRRLSLLMETAKVNHLSEIIPRILHDEDYFNSFIMEISVTVTEMFRDPSFFHVFIQHIIPILRTYPFIKIWHAGCATGEEVYSMAILLKEAGILDKTTIYATDINSHSIKCAREGIYKLENIDKYTANYKKAGGKFSFSDYYYTKYQYVKMHDNLKKKIIFATHNLVCDGVFNEMHVIICRNVFIYFDKTLQNKAALLFRDSLVNRGFLCLGTKETIEFLESENDFDCFSKKEKIFRKKTKTVAK